MIEYDNIQIYETDFICGKKKDCVTSWSDFKHVSGVKQIYGFDKEIDYDVRACTIN